jgi:hypothetical protein
MTKSNSSSALLTLWYKPGHTLQGLIADSKGEKAAMLIVVLFGLVLVWPRYYAQQASGVGVLLVGGAAALAALMLFSWLLRNFSRWFGGAAKLAEVRTALGWGLLPWTLLSALLLGLIAAQDGDARRMFPLFFGVLLYGFVIVLSTLSVALRISLMKTFFCLFLTFLVSIFPLTFILQLFIGSPAPTP